MTTTAFFAATRRPIQAWHAWKLIRTIRSLDVDAAFILHRDWRWNLAHFLARVPLRYGFSRDLKGAFLTRAAAPPPRCQEVQQYAQVFSLQPGFEIRSRSMALFPNQRDHDTVEQWMAGFSGRPIAALAPGGAANVKETLSIKRWPSARYQALIRRLLDETDFNLLLIGGPTDRETHEAMAPDTARILDGAGVLSLQQSYLALKKCRVMVTHDCGPMHLGAAGGVPVLALFGPTDPWSLAHLAHPAGRYIWKGEHMNCSPCYSHGRFPTCAHQACMTAIGVDEVFNALMGVAADGEQT